MLKFVISGVMKTRIVPIPAMTRAHSPEILTRAHSPEICFVVYTQIDMRGMRDQKYANAFFKWGVEHFLYSTDGHDIAIQLKTSKEWHKKMFLKYMSRPHIYYSDSIKNNLIPKITKCDYVSITRLDFDDSLSYGFFGQIKARFSEILEETPQIRGVYFVNNDVYSNQWIVNATHKCKTNIKKKCTWISGWSLGQTVILQKTSYIKLIQYTGVQVWRNHQLMIKYLDEMIMRRIHLIQNWTSNYTLKNHDLVYKHESITGMRTVRVNDFFHPVGNYSITPLSSHWQDKYNLLSNTCYKDVHPYFQNLSFSDTSRNNKYTIRRSNNRLNPKTLKARDEISCIYNTSVSHILTLIKKWGGYKMIDALRGWYFEMYNDTWKYKENFHYRGEPVETFATVSGLRKYYKRRFGKNLVSDYYSKTNSSYAFTLLHKLTKRKSLPNSKLCVLHLRMGDTIDTDTLWDSPKKSRWPPTYVFPKKYYVSMVQPLKRMNVTDIVITAATYHFMVGISKRKISTYLKWNDHYLSIIETFFKENGFRVIRRVNCGLPDEDFIFMSNADIFVQGGGNYSGWIAKMVKMNGGTVLYNRTFIKNQYKLWKNGRCLPFSSKQECSDYLKRLDLLNGTFTGNKIKTR